MKHHYSDREVPYHPERGKVKFLTGRTTDRKSYPRIPSRQQLGVPMPESYKAPRRAQKAVRAAAWADRAPESGPSALTLWAAHLDRCDHCWKAFPERRELCPEGHELWTRRQLEPLMGDPRPRQEA